MSIILEELFGNPTELNAKDLAWRCNARDTEGDAEWRANTKSQSQHKMSWFCNSVCQMGRKLTDNWTMSSECTDATAPGPRGGGWLRRQYRGE